mgnify:CR=1 FL=1
MTAPDVVIVGGGTAGCYAAVAAADAGLDVAVLERKSADEAGHIACGDALKGSDAFPDAIPPDRIDEAVTNPGIDRGIFDLGDDRLEIPVPGELAVLDRKRYGEILLEAAERAGADVRYDTVVQDVAQDDEGRVTGVTVRSNGSAERIGADVVIDATGALSVLQDRADLGDVTFDDTVRYTQFCSAYREIVEVDEPVDWDDALYFKPTDRSAGYLWYFPRTATEINAGVGFQMDEEPMELVEVLRGDMRAMPGFEGAEVVDKLGAALPTRRPYDSAVAPGFVAAGDAAGHVNPTTGGGIAGAAYAGTFAGELAVEAVTSGDASEDRLWRYNERVMETFGARYAALDAYNVFVANRDAEEIQSLMAAMPGEKISEALYEGEASVGLGLKARIAVETFGHWGLLYDLYRTKRASEALLDVYEDYPSSPEGFGDWRERRDAAMERVYDAADAEAKY